MMISIRQYTPSLNMDWSHVLKTSKNGLFLFDRRFIEYHGNRFDDLSSIAYIDDKPVAIFPAARTPNTNDIVSHPGLTFGGVIFQRELRGKIAFEVIDAFLHELRDRGASSLTVKLVPNFFSSYPSAEMEYALWRRGFALSRRDLSSILPLNNPLQFNTLKRRGIARATKYGIQIKETSASEFHAMLTEVLRTHHGVTPVHSVEDMELIISRFPSEIDIFGACLDGNLLAGAMIFRYGHVWHTQYLACSESGRTLGALDLVISTVKEKATEAGAQYLSFGTSTEQDGRVLNMGLLWQKESFGARSIVCDSMSGELK